MSKPEKEKKLVLNGDPITIMDENDEIKAKWPKVLVEYAEVSRYAIEACDITPEQAKRIAYKVVMALAKQRGGKIEYLPTGQALTTALKHKQIWDEFNGNNIDALSEKFATNHITLYKIIRQQRVLHTNKIQHSLFQ